MMRVFACALALHVLLGIGAARAQDERATPGADRPDVVVILFDDMGFSDIGAYGGEIPTPNIDALAARGLRFTQFYNSARCSPTRAALLTGLNPHQAGMGYLAGLRRPDSRGLRGRLLDRSVTMAEVLKEAGYFTAMAGKWHLSELPGSVPEDRGFDRSLSARAGGIYFKKQAPKPNTKGRNARRWLTLNGEPIETDDPRLGEDDWYGTDLWTRWGLRFADEAIERDQPYFLYLAHVAPHFPLMAPPEDVARFRGRYLEGWAPLREARFAKQQAMGLLEGVDGLTAALPDVDDWSRLSEADKDRFDAMMAVYAAAVARFDKSVGDVVAHLEERGTLDDTIIFILSDNGGNAESGPKGLTGPKPWGGRTSNIFVGMNWATLQNTPFRFFKHFTAEGGIATPLIVHWPAGLDPALAGSFVRTPGHVIDLMPTLTAVTGAEYPASFEGHDVLPMEGVSLLPALSGAPIERPWPLFWEHEGNKAVRDGRWKALQRLGGAWELYDLETDRTELRDLAAREPDRLSRMIAAWDAWAERTYVDP